MTIRDRNFVKSHKPKVWLVTSIIWSTLFVSVFLAVQLSSAVFQMQEHSDKIALHIAELEKEVVAMRTAEQALPGATEFVELQRQVSFFNDLVGSNYVPVTKGLETLEEILPEGIRLSKYHQTANGGLIIISIQSENEETLPPVLSKMEDVPAFQSVILERQVRVREGDRNLMQFDVKAKYQ